MSSSDQVRITYQPEIVMGEVPVNGDLGTCRILSDSLSGTPRTITADEISSGDRQSTGQDVVGLDVAGGFAVKLSPDPFHDVMIAAAMMSPWSSEVAVDGLITLDAATGVLTFVADVASVDLTTLFRVGDMITLRGLTASENQGNLLYVQTVTAAGMVVILPDGMVDAAGENGVIVLNSYVEIGKMKGTFSFMKDFLDLTQRSITYSGMRSNGMDFNFAFGEHVTGNYNFAGTAWGSPTPADSDGRTIKSISQHGVLNASQDMGLVVLDGQKVDFCIKTLSLALDNGLQPTECIGHIAPTDQVPGDANVTVAMEAYLADSNFDLVKEKMENNPVSLAYDALNSDGQGYAFQIPAILLSFPDPGNEGKGTQAMLNMEGMAKKDETFGNTLRVYKIIP